MFLDYSPINTEIVTKGNKIENSFHQFYLLDLAFSMDAVHKEQSFDRISKKYRLGCVVNKLIKRLLYACSDI